MKVIFTGDPLELERGESLSRLSTTMYGKTFPMGAEVDVSDLPQKLQQKLLNNAHFRAAGLDAPPVPLVVPVSALRPTPAEMVAAADGDAEEAEAAAAHVERASKRKPNK